MFRSLQHANALSTSGHICLSCRQKLLATQSRWQSQHSNTDDRNNEDWFNNFNDIGLSTLPLDKPKQSQKHSRLDGHKTEAQGKGRDGSVDKEEEHRRFTSQNGNTFVSLKPLGRKTVRTTLNAQDGGRQELAFRRSGSAQPVQLPTYLTRPQQRFNKRSRAKRREARKASEEIAGILAARRARHREAHKSSVESNSHEQFDRVDKEEAKTRHTSPKETVAASTKAGRSEAFEPGSNTEDGGGLNSSLRGSGTAESVDAPAFVRKKCLLFQEPEVRDHEFLRKPHHRLSKRQRYARRKLRRTIPEVARMLEARDVAYKESIRHQSMRHNGDNGSKQFDTILDELKVDLQNDPPNDTKAATVASKNEQDKSQESTNVITLENLKASLKQGPRSSGKSAVARHLDGQNRLSRETREIPDRNTEPHSEDAKLGKNDASESDPAVPKAVKMPDFGSGSTVAAQKDERKEAGGGTKWGGLVRRFISQTLFPETRIHKVKTPVVRRYEPGDPHVKPVTDGQLRFSEDETNPESQFDSKVEDIQAAEDTQEAASESSQRRATFHSVDLNEAESAPTESEMDGTLEVGKHIKIRKLESGDRDADISRAIFGVQGHELNSNKLQLNSEPQLDGKSEHIANAQVATADAVKINEPEASPRTEINGDVTPEPAKQQEKPSQSKKTTKSAGRKSRRTALKVKEGGAGSKSKKVVAAAETTTKANNNLGNHGEHKSLRDVMSLAEAMAGEQTVSTASADPKIVDQPEQQSESLLVDLSKSGPVNLVSIQPSTLEVKALEIPQPLVPGLEYGLDRVLFNPGVYQLQDPHSRVFNFDPYLQKIMPVIEFDFNALKEYKTSSQDMMLSSIAKEEGKRYIGSTSSMTGTLAHFHYLLSDFRPLNLNMLSRGFAMKRDDFTRINRAPNAIFLRWKNGTYAIDADKEFDGANVLMMLGKSMEKLLTLPKSDYERYRKSDPRAVSEVERTAPEAFQYTTMGDFLMRSQLDAHDPRLPGTGMFDLKTRAVLSVRMDAEDFEPMVGYEIHTLQGRFQSYEREYYDMMRATMLKYLLQARMGRMNGIFAAYHNVERIFGFQYISIEDMDRAIHGQIDPCLGDQEFRTSLELMNKVFDKATAKFPEQSLRFHFETAEEKLDTGSTTVMWIFAEPMKDAEIDRIQSTSKAKVAEFEKTMMGFDRDEKDASQAVEDVVSAQETKSETATSTPTPTISNTQSGTSSSEYTTSNSGADPTFLTSISSRSHDRRPLFVASLICQTRVNGTSEQRPSPLKPSDKWEVDYLLQELEANDSTWARYEQTKARRKELFDEFRDEDEDVDALSEGSKKKGKSDGFIKFLRELAKNGREFRSKMDRLEADKVPVVLGQSLGTAPEGTPATAGEEYAKENVEDVGSYMDWLYGSDGGKSSSQRD